MVNLDTTQPLLGQATSRLKSMHNGQGCLCDVIPVDEIRINHYLGSRGDYLGKTKRYWQVSDVVGAAVLNFVCWRFGKLGGRRNFVHYSTLSLLATETFNVTRL